MTSSPTSFLNCKIDPATLTHLGSGTYSDVFAIADQRLVLRLSYYDDAVMKHVGDLLKQSEETQDAAAKKALVERSQRAMDIDPVRVQMKMAEITNKMIRLKISPHFVRVYGKPKDCRDFFRHMRQHNKIPERRLIEMKKYPYATRYNNIAVMDRYSSSLTAFLRSSRLARMDHPDVVLKVVVFQVVYTLAALQQYIEAFRHNDCSTNNVLVQIDGTESPAVTRAVSYLVHGDARPFLVPDLGVSVAVADFDFVSGGKVLVPGLKPGLTLKNRKVRDKSAYNRDPTFINPSSNQSYDVQYFLYGLDKLLSRNAVIPETRAFLGRMLHGVTKNRAKSSNSNLYPLKVLRDTYFDAFRRELPGGVRVVHEYEMDLEEGQTS